MTDVSRETPPTPEAARGAFPSARVRLAEGYVELLATEGVVRGLIGPREAPRLWDRHLLNCAALSPLVADGATVCDVGSGAGLPGVVLAIARPDLSVDLVEPLLRRTTFLTEVVERLGLENVTVTRARADALHGTRTYEVVTSRAVAPLPRLLEWCMPLVSPTGAMVAMKGASVTDEIEAATDVLSRLGCSAPEIVDLHQADATSTTRAVRVSWADPSRVSSARRSGSKSKRRRPS